MIHSITSSQAARMLVSDWRLVKRWLFLIWHGVHHFFLPQYRSVLWPKHRRVASLSHPLDREIPFRPGEVVTYLGYITFWFKTLRWFYDRFGLEAMPDIRRSMDEVFLLYREAGAVYRRCQSTTSTRAPLPRHPYFALIYLVDPHLACIPSLHVLLICHNDLGAARMLRRRGLRGDEAERLQEVVRAEAVRIVEAVLLVKQHSLIDVAPSLFLLTVLFPDYEQATVADFVSRLFREWRIPEPVKARMRTEILSTYDEFVSRWRQRGSNGHRELILEFLDRYTPGGRRERVQRRSSSSPRRRGVW